MFRCLLKTSHFLLLACGLPALLVTDRDSEAASGLFKGDVACAARNEFNWSGAPKTMIRICSRPYWNHTGVVLESGATYELKAAGTWTDASRDCGPDGYLRGNFFQELFRGLRRSPSNQWFALMGALDDSRDTIFLIGSQATYVPPRRGELVCFANDVPGFYWNNAGSVTLSVSRRE